MRGAAGFGQPPGRGLAQAMGRTVWQPGFIALFPKPAAKCGPLERSAAAGGHECQMVTGCCFDDGRKGGVQRNDQFNAGLLLLDVESTVADVLRAHAGHIATTLSGVEQERERKPCS